MTYNEAKNELDNNVNNMPKHVSLFIAPLGSQSDISNLRLRIDDNETALKELGFIDNDNLEVYSTYQDGDHIYYPTLSDFLLMQQSSSK